MTAGARPDRAERLETFGEGLAGSNLERAGDHNQRVTLHAIRVNGPITRAELAEIVGLTAQTIANITKRLLADGLILEAGRLQGQRGQPAMRLAINPEGAYSIGLNIDRDHITFVALDFLGKVRAHATREVHFAPPDEVLAFLRRQIGEAIASGAVAPDRLAGIGVAVPDDIARANLPHRPDHYRVWDEIDIAALAAQALPGPVHVENDAAAAAMGELQLGLGLRTRSFVYVLVSAGLGGGLVIDGAYFRGARGRSGEIGFLPAAGGTRSLEELVSLTALYDHLAAAGAQVSTPSELLRLDEAGRAALGRWLDLAADALCEPLMILSAGIDPEAILIGGRLPAEIVDGLCERLNARLAAKGLPAVAPVLRAALAADAAAMGAAILPFSDRFLPSRSALLMTGV